MNWRRGKTLWTTPILKSGLWHGLFMSVQAANFGGLWALIASLNRRVARRSLVRFRQGSGCLFAFRAVRGRSHMYELAQRENLVDDPDFEIRPVAWLVHVGPGGEFRGIVGTHSIPESESGKKKPRPVPGCYE